MSLKLRIRRTFKRARVSILIVTRKAVEITGGTVRTAASRAGGFQSIKGMTDANAKLGRPHRFEIGKRRLLRRFLRDVEPLIRQGQIRVRVNGRVYDPASL